MDWEADDASGSVDPGISIGWTREDPPPDASSASSDDLEEEEDRAAGRLEDFDEEGEEEQGDDEQEGQEENHGDEEEPPSTLEDNNPETAALERDLLAVCNALHPGKGDAPVFILTNETLLNLQDVVNLLRQSRQLDADGKHDMTAESLLLSPKYQLINAALVPLWEACLDTPEEPEYLDRLLFLLARVLVPPGPKWKYAHIPHRVRWYVTSIESVKPAFLRPRFWAGLAHLHRRLRVQHASLGKTPETEEQMTQFVHEEEQLRSSSEGALSVAQRERLEAITAEIRSIKQLWEKRKEHAHAHLTLLKMLLVALLRLPPPPDVLEQAEAAVVPTEFTRSVAACIARMPSKQCHLDLGGGDARHAASFLLRHNRFNPTLARRRMQQLGGAYLYYERGDRRMRTVVRRKKPRKEGCPLPNWDLQDLILRPRQGDMEKPLRAVMSDEAQSLAQHLQTFLRFGFNRCLGAWFADCAAEDELLSSTDAFKLVNFMTWILCFKRHAWQLTRSTVERTASQLTPEEKRTLLAELVADVLALRAALDTNGICFVHRLFYEHVKKKQLRRGSDTLARLCLRALVEQIRFGTFLMQQSAISAETLSVVGQCVIEDVFKCNMTSDIVWCMRNMRPYTQDPDLILYTVEAAYLLLRALQSVGGAATVVLQRRRGGGPASNTNVPTKTAEDAEGPQQQQLTGRSRRLELQEFVTDMYDSRVISNLMRCLARYKTNPPFVNVCLVRILFALTRDRDEKREGSKHYVALFFQLSHFDFLMRVLQDGSLQNRADGKELTGFSRWILSEFWSVFHKNRFVLIELFFGKTWDTASRVCSYADPEILMSVYSDYTKGLDHEFLDQFGGDDAMDKRDMEEWKRKLESQRRLAKTAWTPDENRLLVRLWDAKKKLPSPVVHIRRSLRVKRTAKAIAAQLVRLRVLEPEGEEEEADEDELRDEKPLLQAVLRFRTSVDIRGCWTASMNDSVNDNIIRGILGMFKEIQSLRHNTADGATTNHIVDIPPRTSLEILKVREFRDLMIAMGATSRDEDNQQEGLEDDDGALFGVARETDLWIVPGTTRTSIFATRIRKLEQYTDTAIENLKDQLGRWNDKLPASSLRRARISKVRVVGALAALKSVETLTSWTDDEAQAALRDVFAIFKDVDTAIATISGHTVEQETQEATEDVMIECVCPGASPDILRLPPKVTVQNLASAVAAALENLSKRRRQHLLTTGAPPSSSETLELGRLTFPPQDPNTPFGAVVQFILTSSHPLLVELLRSVGFQRWGGETATTAPEGAQSSDHRAWNWVIPVTQTLQKYEMDIHHVRAYTTGRVGTLVSTVQRCARAPEPTSAAERDGRASRRSRDAAPAVVPLLVVDVADDETRRGIANTFRKLHEAETKSRLAPLVISAMTRLLSRLQRWCLDRIERQQLQPEEEANDHGGGADDIDLVLASAQEQEEEPRGEQRTETEERSSPPSSWVQFKDMIGFQRCLYALLGRPDNVTAPHTWYWSRGCKAQVVLEYLALARVCVAANPKLLKKYARGRITLEELENPVTARPGHRFDIPATPSPPEDNEDDATPPPPTEHEETFLSEPPAPAEASPRPPGADPAAAEVSSPKAADTAVHDPPPSSVLPGGRSTRLNGAGMSDCKPGFKREQNVYLQTKTKKYFSAIWFLALQSTILPDAMKERPKSRW